MREEILSKFISKGFLEEWIFVWDFEGGRI